MIRNNLSLLQIFSILMLGIALSLFVFAWTMHAEFLQKEDSNSFYNTEIWFRNGFIIASMLILVPALGLLVRQKWAVLVFIILFWILIIVWTTFIVLIYMDLGARMDERIAILIAISILIYASLVAGILYLDNAYVLAPLGNKEVTEETLPDVLDQ